MALFPRHPPTDPGLQQIADYCRGFRAAHQARLLDTPMSDDERARELAAVTVTAAALEEQLRREYRTRTQR